jgi:BirA family transcriptional regulator, biotin operon repressor / biotin---[acetyl-CoA-carboxylase] ligase
MHQFELFSILDTVESTNNYAMQQIHAGLAIDGQAWFAKEQWGGKGQRGKTWISKTGENIILSLSIKPNPIYKHLPFCLSMLIANVCRLFLGEIARKQVKIKWPNDIYIDDRKAGGILIENVFKGKEWEWAVIGIGINVNQIMFDENAANPTSLKLITWETYDVIELAKKLHCACLKEIKEQTEIILIKNDFNAHLYKKDETISLRKNNAVFKTEIIAVNEYGQLLTKDAIERSFEVGEIDWIF